MKRILMIILLTTLVLSACGTQSKENKIELSHDDITEVKSTLKETVISPASDLSSDDNWFEAGGKMTFKGNKGSMQSESEEIAEAWYKYKDGLSMTKDFVISAKVNVPKSWDAYNKENAQVGVGVFVGKYGDEGKLVYEADLCTVANGSRFVQGQMIKNRKGGEPVDVNYKEVDTIKATLDVYYQHELKTLTLYLNNNVIGSQTIDENGSVNWNMSKDDKFVVGIMGFSEWVKITSDYPSIEAFTIYQ